MTNKPQAPWYRASVRFIGSSIGKWWRGLRIGLPGIWLMGLYLVFGLLVVFSLSAHQLQFAIKSTSSADGTSVGLWEVLQVHGEWKSLRRVTDSNSRLLERATAQQEQQQLQLEDIESDILKQEAQCIGLMNEFKRFLGHNRVVAVNAGTPASKCEHVVFNDEKAGAQAEVESDTPEFTNRVEAIAAAIDQLNISRAERINIESRVKNLTTKTADLRSQINTDKKGIEELLSDNKLGIESGDFLNSLSYLEAKQGLPVVPNFTEMPPDMLTLILVMSMGALGGTINLTRMYLRSRTEDAGSFPGGSLYLFRPILGAITALAVFILAKAGVLIVATPVPGGGAALSPFFISFLGIISGLLADQALDTIQRAGNSWFKQTGDAGRERWAIGLGPALGRQPNGEIADDTSYKQQHRALTNMLGVSSATLDSWVTEEKPVPVREQSLIAAFFRESPRRLFTDLRSGDSVEEASIN